MNSRPHLRVHDPAIAPVRGVAAFATLAIIALLGVLAWRNRDLEWGSFQSAAIVVGSLLALLPVLWPGSVTVRVGLVGALVGWLAVGANLGWPAHVLCLVLHLAAVTWMLAWQLPAATLVHLSAVRALARRHVVPQLMGQLVLVLAWSFQTMPTSPLIAMIGLGAAAVVLGFLLIWAHRAEPDQDRAAVPHEHRAHRLPGRDF